MSGIESLIGETVKSISSLEIGVDEVIFTCASGKIVRMFHWQNCCESVTLADVCGDESDVVGGVITSAEERISQQSSDYGSETWTFYDIQSSKGSLWLRWCGESNGYYSEDVDIEVTTTE